MRWLAASLLFLAAGCGGREVVVPEVVKVPVPVPCLDRLPEAPAVAGDEELLGLDDYALVLTVARDRKLLEAAYGELRAAAGACLK